MKIFTMGMFWGVIVILFGINILLKAVFNIHFPFFRLIFGILIILWGITIIFGFKPRINGDTAIFSNARFETESRKKEYNVIFGTGTVDLSAPDFSNMPEKIKINSIFAVTQVLIDPNTEITIEANSAFGHSALPNADSIVFGSISRTLGSGPKKMKLEVNAIFAQIRVLYK